MLDLIRSSRLKSCRSEMAGRTADWLGMSIYGQLMPDFPAQPAGDVFRASRALVYLDAMLADQLLGLNVSASLYLLSYQGSSPVALNARRLLLYFCSQLNCKEPTRRTQLLLLPPSRGVPHQIDIGILLYHQSKLALAPTAPPLSGHRDSGYEIAMPADFERVCSLLFHETTCCSLQHGDSFYYAGAHALPWYAA